MIELRIFAAARHEFDDAIDWYAAQSMSLAERFETAVDDEIKAICRRPLRNPKWDKTRRFTLVPGFPYYIVYRAFPSRVKIVAVFHTARDASAWTDR
jgi:plasmid stabilization system protein ParE